MNTVTPISCILCDLLSGGACGELVVRLLRSFPARQEELKYQGEVRDEMATLETSLAQVKRDYEILKIEHEQTMAANEQAAPIAK